MGIHRISRQSTSAVTTFASSSSPSSLLVRSLPPRRYASTAVATSTVHLDDPYDRILPPKFPSEDDRERARAALVKHIGVSSTFLPSVLSAPFPSFPFFPRPLVLRRSILTIHLPQSLLISSQTFSPIPISSSLSFPSGR